MREFLRTRAAAFGHAFRGWWHVLRTQRNAWVHAVITVTVLAMAGWLRLPRRDWAVLGLTIALVWTMETMNTALEAVVDLVSPQPHPLARIGKDVAAAAVLMAALAAVLIGLLILGPPLWQRLFG